MNRVIAILAIVPLTLFAAPPVAAAGLTNAQVTEQCRPQLERLVQYQIADQQEAMANSKRDAAQSPELREGLVEQIRVYNRDLAELRSKGIGQAENQAMINEIVHKLPGIGKAKIRQAIAEAKTYHDPTSIATACMMEAMLASIEGKPQRGAASGTAVPPLRATAVLEAHNPAADASQCLELITKRDFDAKGVRSNMGAVFRNKCNYPVETRWCIGEGRCSKLGYDNLATMPASGDRGISYDEGPKGVKTLTHWAACRTGFAHRPDFAGSLHYACK